MFGIQNLRVVDASVMPKVTNFNLNSPTMAVAQKGVTEIFQKKETGEEEYIVSEIYYIFTYAYTHTSIVKIKLFFADLLTEINCNI